MAKVATIGLREQLIQQWNDLGSKTRELGDALPAASFEEAPAEGTRSAAEVFRHLAFWNGWLAAKIRGEEPDGAANEVPRSSAPTRPKALAVYSASVAEAAAALAARDGKGSLPDDTAALFASMFGHSAEHYGQLVVYARLSGVVPPTSR